MPLAEVNSASKSYPRRMGLRTTAQTVVDNVSLTIARARRWAWWANTNPEKRRWRAT
jgi:hypothetical protein